MVINRIIKMHVNDIKNNENIHFLNYKNECSLRKIRLSVKPVFNILKRNVITTNILNLFYRLFVFNILKRNVITTYLKLSYEIFFVFNILKRNVITTFLLFHYKVLRVFNILKRNVITTFIIPFISVITCLIY